jgi:hypothetical protein
MKKLITVFFTVLLVTSLTYAQWTEQISGVANVLYSVSPVDNNIVWVCGSAGKVLLTTNGGTNWVVTPTPSATLALYNIWGISATTALVTGSSASATFVYKTTNSGANWTQVFTQTSGFIDGIASGLGNANNIFMYGDPVGNRWSLWFSTNTGSNWDSTGFYLAQAGSEAGYNNALFYYSNPSVLHDWVWFGTNNSRIYQGSFSQTSVSWVSEPTTGQTDILVIQFMDSSNGVAGTTTGILYTSNGGTNWLGSTSVPGSGSINGLAASNNYGELFYTRGSSIYHTTNSGVNWDTATTQTGTYFHMQRARTEGNYNIWAIRNNGGISKYTSPIGIRRIGTEVPGKYTLYQNYPNPFNPATIISFEVPSTSFVVLTIYDAAGRIVETIINKQFTAGHYELEWNASKYSSGIYFYKLEAGNFSETKKMVLVK